MRWERWVIAVLCVLLAFMAGRADITPAATASGPVAGTHRVIRTYTLVLKKSACIVTDMSGDTCVMDRIRVPRPISVDSAYQFNDQPGYWYYSGTGAFYHPSLDQAPKLGWSWHAGWLDLLWMEIIQKGNPSTGVTVQYDVVY